ncbi:MAG: hypothetical protein R6W82_10720 [bacterium]
MTRPWEGVCMYVRRLTAAAALSGLLLFLGASEATAQFTPRFSTEEQGPKAQWHVGLGTTVVNMGDYTSEHWPELETPVPVLNLRFGVAIPIKEETLFLMPEIEVHTAGTEGVYNVPPLYGPAGAGPYEVPTITQQGFSVLLNVLRGFDERRTLVGGGIGYHLIRHDPEITSAMQSDGSIYHRDPFMHLGIGGQIHFARALTRLKENIVLMGEVRYEAAFLGGNVSDRDILMSQFILGFYLAIE